MKRVVILLAGPCIALISLSSGIGAVSFQAPAGLGDRRIELQWMPDSDDPLFTGNIKLFPLAGTVLGDEDIVSILFDRFGTEMWTVGRHAETVARLVPEEDSTWVPDRLLTPLGAGAEVLCASLHPSGHLLAAGLSDGRIAVWRPKRGPEPILYAGHDGPCRELRFPGGAGERDSTFFTAGDDGRLVRWTRPGVVSRDSILGEGAISAMSVTRTGEQVVLGKTDGSLSLWGTAGLFDRVYGIDQAHAGRIVTQILLSPDETRIVSADETGRVRIWNKRFGGSLGSGFTPPSPTRIFIAYTPRRGDQVIYATQEGTLGALDGFGATPFDIETSVGRAITAFALSLDGRTSLLGGAGRLDWWYQGACVPSLLTPECFGGYIVWRGVSLEDEDLVKLRVFQYGDSTWPWTALDTLRAFVDPDSVTPFGGDPERFIFGPHNGVPYYYCLTKYYLRFYDGRTSVVYSDLPQPQNGCYREELDGDPMALIARNDPVRTKPLLDQIFVVPNPYVADDPLSHFSPAAQPIVRFEMLPSDATIRIFTVSGDLVRTLHHYQTASQESGGSCPWDLRNDEQREVVSGVYIYAVETPSGEQRTGFLTLVR
ncbi:MAG: hypothetical protein V1774_08305 [Candidatus Eisenbacteria bacterium]